MTIRKVDDFYDNVAGVRYTDTTIDIMAENRNPVELGVILPLT